MGKGESKCGFRIILSVFYFMVLAAYPFAAHAETMTAIYSGKDTVDLQLQSSSGVKYELYRLNGGAGLDVLLNTWDTLNNPEYANTTLYQSDTGCGGGVHCEYRLSYYAWQNNQWQSPLTAAQIIVDASKEKGTLHNSSEWQIKLGRSAISWNGKPYTFFNGDGVQEVHVADGALNVADALVFLNNVNLDVRKDAIINASNSSFANNADGFGITITGFDGAPYPSYFLKTTFTKMDVFVNSSNYIWFSECTFTDSDLYLNTGSKNAKIETSTFQIEDNQYVDIRLMQGSTGASFKNNTMQDVQLSISETSDTLIEGNTLSGVTYIILNDRTTFKNNQLHIGDYFKVEGSGSLLTGNTITVTNNSPYVNIGGSANTVDGNDIQTHLQSENSHSQTITNNTVKSITLLNNSKSTVSRNTVQCAADGQTGIYATGINTDGGFDIGEHDIENNHVTGCGTGIKLKNTSYNTVKDNTVIRNKLTGIVLDYSASNNQIIGNGVIENGYAATTSPDMNRVGGIRLGYQSDNNTFAFNKVEGSIGSGIIMGYSDGASHGSCNDNGFHENIIDQSTKYGINFYSSTVNQRNLIFNNSIKRSGIKNANDKLSNETIWNHAKESVNGNIIGGSYQGGNYWDDYAGSDADRDGLGDTPYTVFSSSGLVYDQLPLCLPEKGDIDGLDGVTLADAILALRVMAGVNPAGIRTNYPTSGVDVNGDGRIGLAEAVYILQKVAGMR